MFKKGLVSIIMPCYNASQFIEEAINSVVSQVYTSWELLVVDDNSTDNSCDIIHKHQSRDSRILLIRNKKKTGAAMTRNRALDSASGEYIAFLDADDTWAPEKLESQISFMQRENITLCYSSYHIIDKESRWIGSVTAQHQINEDDLLKSCAMGMLTTTYNANDIGKFYFQSIGHEDFLMKLEVLKVIGVAKGQKEFLASYRITSQGLSRNKIRAAIWQWKIFKNYGLSFTQRVYYFSHYAWRGVNRFAKMYFHRNPR